MNTNNSYEEKSCFIITPIGGNNSTIRESTEGLLQNAIFPVLENLGFNPNNIKVAHRISESGSINRQIVTRIIEDDLNIVNLTGLNPNVMYELAIRHSVGKPVIIIAEEGTVLPFDIYDQRTIFYKDNMLGAVQLRENLIEVVSEVFQSSEIDNPVIKIIKENSVLNQVQELDGNSVKIIFNRLESIERSISRISSHKNKKTNKTYNNISSDDNKFGVYITFKDNMSEDDVLNFVINNLNHSLDFSIVPTTGEDYYKVIYYGANSKSSTAISVKNKLEESNLVLETEIV